MYDQSMSSSWPTPGGVLIGLLFLLALIGAVIAFFKWAKEAIARLRRSWRFNREHDFSGYLRGIARVIAAWTMIGAIVVGFATNHTERTQLDRELPWGNEAYIETARSVFWWQYSLSLDLVEREFSEPGPETTTETRTTTTTHRIGAICRDGWRSSATGSGACSWHGGVARWLQEETSRLIKVAVPVPPPPPPLGYTECSNRGYGLPDCSDAAWERSDQTGSWTDERLRMLSDLMSSQSS